MDELARFLFGQPTAITTLLAQHDDDGRGHCQASRVADQRDYLSWPCLLHEAASLAATARSDAGLPAARRR